MTTMTLKNFTEEYTKILQGYTADQLRAILVSMANDVKPKFRSEFINNLLIKKQKNKQLIIPSEEILNEIESLIEVIESQSNEEPDWGEYNDDDDSLGEFSRFIPSLSYLFDKIETLFDYGQYDLARQAYQALFTVFEIEDDYGRGICLYDIEDLDRDEVRARYLRSIYLSEKPDNRVKSILETMNQFARSDYTARPTLQDIINISVDPLPEFLAFLTQWIQITQKKPEPQFDAWFREAMFLSEGAKGLEKIAKSEGAKRPRVYIDWIKALIDSNDYSKAWDAIRYTLEQLPRNQPIRAAIGDLKVLCGEQLKNEEMVSDGKWLSFEAKPDLSKLIDLYYQAKPSERQILMQQAAEIIKTYKQKISGYDSGKQWETDSIETPSFLNNSLLMHAYLLSNQLEQAFKLAQEGQSLGWSSADNPQSLFVAYCLAQTVCQVIKKLPISLRTFLNEILNNSHGMYCCDELHNQLITKIEEVYQEMMFASNVIPNKMNSWCIMAAEKRISAIVSNQHRGAYDRAASLTVACTDALKCIKPLEAVKFFEGIKNKFPRHSAFQAELREHVARFNATVHYE